MDIELIKSLTIWALVLAQFITTIRVNRLANRVKELES